MCNSSKRSAEERHFSCAEEEQLIELVSGHELLWKSTDPDYKNNFKKEEVWNTIGERFGKPGNACKNRWRNSRDYYKRSKKDDLTASGKPAKKKRAIYWDMLNFLDNTQNNQVVQEVADETPSQDISESDTSNNEESFSVQTTSKVILPAKDNGSCKKKVTSNDALLKSLERKKQRDHLMKTVATAFSPQMDKDDDVDHFFKSMAMTVKSFSPAERAEAKFKVMEVVSGIEMRRFSSTDSQD